MTGNLTSDNSHLMVGLEISGTLIWFFFVSWKAQLDLVGEETQLKVANLSLTINLLNCYSFSLWGS